MTHDVDVPESPGSGLAAWQAPRVRAVRYENLSPDAREAADRLLAAAAALGKRSSS